jgi:tRNA A-37 threonylcarbamoyl transferase component Bud32
MLLGAVVAEHMEILLLAVITVDVEVVQVLQMVRWVLGVLEALVEMEEVDIKILGQAVAAVVWEETEEMLHQQILELEEMVEQVRHILWVVVRIHLRGAVEGQEVEQ